MSELHPSGPADSTLAPASGRRAATTRRRGATVLAAALAGIATWGVAVALTDVPQITRGDTTEEIGAVPVLLFAVAAALAGWGLLAVLERMTARARRVWTVVAVSVLLVSLGAVSSGVDAASKVTIALLHLVVGAVVIAGLTRSGQARGSYTSGTPSLSRSTDSSSASPA